MKQEIGHRGELERKGRENDKKNDVFHSATAATVVEDAGAKKCKRFGNAMKRSELQS